MIQNLGNRMEKIQEMFNKDLEELKSKQTMSMGRGQRKKKKRGNSLAVQWLGLGTFTAGARVQSLVWKMLQASCAGQGFLETCPSAYD